jgi:hypothetical protein
VNLLFFVISIEVDSFVFSSSIAFVSSSNVEHWSVFFPPREFFSTLAQAGPGFFTYAADQKISGKISCSKGLGFRRREEKREGGEEKISGIIIQFKREEEKERRERREEKTQPALCQCFICFEP